MSLIQIYNATDDTRPYVQVLAEVPVGGYIFDGTHFIRKTGTHPAMSRRIDLRHLDHEFGSHTIAKFGAVNATTAEWRKIYQTLYNRLDNDEWDAEVFALADMDQTMDAASYRAQ